MSHSSGSLLNGSHGQVLLMETFHTTESIGKTAVNECRRSNTVAVLPPLVTNSRSNGRTIMSPPDNDRLVMANKRIGHKAAS